MKKTRAKNIFRGISRSLNRFLSIMFIVALGAGFMAGLSAASPDMYDTADKYFDDYKLYDIDVKSTIGFDKSDADALSDSGLFTSVFPSKTWDVVVKDKSGEEFTSRVYGFVSDGALPEVNSFVLKEGRLPQNSGECVIQPEKGRYFAGNIKIGDTLYVDDENAAVNELVVVGFVESPLCISIVSEPSTAGKGSVELDIYTSDDFFTFDYYTDIYLIADGGAALGTFTDEYDSLIERASAVVEETANDRIKARQDELAELSRLLDELSGGINPTLGFDTLLAVLKEALAEAAEASDTAGELLKPITEAVESASSLADLPAIAAAVQTVKNGIDKANDAYSEARWVVRTRHDSAGFASYDDNVGKVAALCKIFPMFFFAVALLVSLTTMTRLVEENRGQIGTLKALGFSDMQILGEYILYSLLSSALGCLLGFSVGFKLFPAAISSAYGMMFTLPETLTPVRPSIILQVAPVTVLSILIATVAACWNEFRSCPARLMQPKAPAAGKRILLERIGFIWKKLPFTQKVTARNLFRYKKRFIMTIIGVAGCSALLLTGFGLRDSISDIVDKQFGEIYRYQLNVITSGENLSAELSDALEGGSVSDHLVLAEESGRVYFGDESRSLSIDVPKESDSLADFITLRQRKNGKAIALDGSGIVLTEKLCEQLGAEVGDTVTLENADGKKSDCVIIGICENYLSSLAYITPELYESSFGTSPEYRHVLCVLENGTTADDAAQALLSCEGVQYISSSESLKSSFSDSIKSIDGVVLVLIVAAGLLCMVVLYNLTNVNICEREKELATIRVLGFHKREAENYIFRETNVLSLLGTVVGLFVGVWLHSFVVKTVEIDQVMFGRSIYAPSYLWAVLISMGFTIIVNQIMRRQIRKIDMAEAMKSNE